MFSFTQGARWAYDKSIVMYKIQNYTKLPLALGTI